jgi:hypothetical protein
MMLAEQEEIGVGPFAGESRQEANPIGTASAAQLIGPPGDVVAAATIGSTHVALRRDRAALNLKIFLASVLVACSRMLNGLGAK